LPQIQRLPDHPCYQSPAAQHLTPYLAALSHLLVLTLIRTPEHRSRLRDERGLLHYLQTVAMNLADHDPSQFMFFGALARARRFGSTIVGEFERAAVARLRELFQADRYSARLAPWVYAVFGLRDEFEWAATGRFALEPGYAAWCDVLSTEILEPVVAAKQAG
jgi:hypothetical protein